MAHQIQITSRLFDTRADVLQKKIKSLGYPITSVVINDVYTIDKSLSERQLTKIVSLLVNPVNQKGSYKKMFAPSKFGFAIEIGFLPGVTDNVATTVKEMVEDATKMKFSYEENIYSSQILFLTGKITEQEAFVIGTTLVNPLIQRIDVKNFYQYKKDRGMGIVIPKVDLHNKVTVDSVNLDMDDEELQRIGKQGIVNPDGSRRGPLALDLTYMKAIRNYFKKLKRHPTDIELESIAQTWSEHCKHTIFADPIDEIKEGLYKTYIKGATNTIRKKKGNKDFCVSVFTDNSGAIEFDDDYIITHKAETHNSPSALDPFGGAITGIVGVNRDAIGFGLGAKPVANIYGFCLGDPRDETPLYKGSNFTQQMLSPRRIMDGVIAGVNAGGNCSGIPTPQGFLAFDERYKGKPLVFAGTVGLIPKKIGKKLSYKKRAKPGDYVVMIGGRVGLDGVHGATFSSEALSSGSPATAVQIGDPITQKKLSDAIIKEARDKNFFNSITDNGAGGISCSVAEMAKEAGGFEVQIEKVPLKYPGLQPWQTWISESQERMTLAVPKHKWTTFRKLMNKRGVEASVIGTFTKKKKCIVTYRGKKIVDMDMDFLHDGLPPRHMKTEYKTPHHLEPPLKTKKDLTSDLLALLTRPNITSFAFISQQYDHEVQAGSVVKPLQGKGRVNGEASIVRPLLSSKKGVALSSGILPWYSDIDTYAMAASAIDTAIRNIVTMGADSDRIALLDNFCWCDSNNPFRLGQLKRAVQACYDYAVAYGTPFISGKDSMFNDFNGYDAKGNPIHVAIPPTLLISSISVIDDVSKTISIDPKFPGDLIYILGETHDELGASEYYAHHGVVGNNVPQVDVKKNKKLYAAYYEAVKRGCIASGISVGRGGLAVALTKMSIAGMLGLEISIKEKKLSPHALLFSETQGRIMVTINPKNKKLFEALFKNIHHSHIGRTHDDNKFEIKINNKSIIKTTVPELKKSYTSTFKNF